MSSNILALQETDSIPRRVGMIGESPRMLRLFGELEKIINDITSGTVISLHSDISTKTEERIIVFTMDMNIEERYG